MEIPDETVEAVARGFYRQIVEYGFQERDQLRFVNEFLDMVMTSQSGTTVLERNVSWKDPHKSSVKQLPLQSERVSIEAFEPRVHTRIVEEWINTPEGRMFLLSRVTSRELGIEEVIESEGNILGLITLIDRTPIGLLAYLNWDRRQRKAELRKLVGKRSCRGKGLGREATGLWIKYGFHSLGLHKIYLTTLDTNIRNIKLNESLGFRTEGVLRDECRFDNSYHDVLRMSLLENRHLVSKAQRGE